VGGSIGVDPIQTQGRDGRIGADYWESSHTYPANLMCGDFFFRGKQMSLSVEQNVEIDCAKNVGVEMSFQMVGVAKQ